MGIIILCGVIMKKIKHAMIFMGLGALATIDTMKMMDCDVNDLMKKEKKMFKNMKNMFCD